MTRFLCALALIPALALLAPAASAERLQVGDVDQTQAEVAAAYAGTTRALAPQSPLLFEDAVTTGAGARLLATLADGSALTLGENARLVIDEFVYDPGTAGGSLGAEIRGAFLFVGGEIEGPEGGKIELRTPVATLGVRGTTVWGGPIDEGYGVLLQEGEVTVTTPTGTVVLDEPGEGTMIIDPNGAPGEPVAWPQDKIDRAVETITFSP